MSRVEVEPEAIIGRDPDSVTGQVLSIDGYFRLPNGFSGSLADALRLLADYHEGPGIQNPHRRAENTEATREERWRSFLWYAFREEVVRWDGGYSIHQYDRGHLVGSRQSKNEP